MADIEDQTTLGMDVMSSYVCPQDLKQSVMKRGREELAEPSGEQYIKSNPS